MTVTAKLTWKPSAPGDTSPPPPTLDVLETVSAGGSQFLIDPTELSTDASDGLGDAVTHPTPPSYGSSSNGIHLYSLTVPTGQNWVKLPTRTLSVSLSWATAQATGSPGMSANYAVQLFSASLSGHSTVDTSAPGNPWDPTHPRFFSGTNCSATASAPAVSGYVTHAQLLVGTTVVKDYYDTTVPGHPAAGPYVTLGTNQSTASLSVNFDSTHFPDGSAIPIKMIVTDTSGNTYDGKIQANAYNKATIYGRNEWETDMSAESAGTFIADSSLISMNHTNKVNRTLGWSATDILGDIAICTVFYVNTHGTNIPPIFLSDLDETSGVQEYVYPSSSYASGTTQVLETRKNVPVTVPPINIAFLDSCLTGTTNDFADAFLWPSTSGSGQTTDQAEIGWNITTNLDSTNVDGYAFWGSLGTGDTIHVARDKMISAYFSPNAPPNPAYTYASVWGDYYARLSYNVYTSDDNQSSNHWFR